MNIAILAHCLFPISEPYAGGLEMITHLLANALQRLGHKVTLFAHPDSDSALNIEGITIDGSQHSEFERETLLYDGESFKQIAFAKAIKEIKNGNYDIVHSHSLNSQAITLLSFLDIPVVHTFHTPIIKSVLQGILSHSTSDEIFYTSVSMSNAYQWQQQGLDVTTIYNGIDLSKWDVQIEPQNDYFFWIGRICKEKAPHHAIVAAINTNSRIILAGPIYDKDYYNIHIAELLLNPLVSYVGHLDHEEINHYLGNATALLFTSIWDEPYGLVLAESLACGTPVLGYKSGASIEILDNTCSILVETGSVKELIRSIPQMRLFNRLACRERAVTFCNHIEMTSNYEELYFRLISVKNVIKKVL